MENFVVRAITGTWLDVKGRVFNPEIDIEGYKFSTRAELAEKGAEWGFVLEIHCNAALVIL